MIWRGLNLDSVDSYRPIVATLSARPRATVGIVIDPGRKPQEYVEPVRAIAKVADVMIRIRDSYAEEVDPLSVEAYEQLAADLYAQLRPWVKAWEIGNEWNGDWLPKDIVEKIHRVAALLKRFGVVRVVTGYLFSDLETVFRTVEANLFDVEVFLWSFYPRWNPEFQPDWPAIAGRLWRAYSAKPNLLQGIGEFGPDGPKDLGSMSVEDRGKMILAMNQVDVGDKRWIRGGFYWEGREDCIPWSRKLYRFWAKSWEGT